MEYKAISEKKRKMTLIQEKEIGYLQYKKWYNMNGNLVVGEKNFHLESKGFLGKKVYLKDESDIIFEAQTSQITKMIIKGFGKNFLLKPKNIWFKEFVLEDESKQIFVKIKCEYVLKNFGYEYQIETSQNFEQLGNKNILLLLIVHLTNYLRWINKAL